MAAVVFPLRKMGGITVDLASFIGISLACIMIVGGILAGGDALAFVNLPSLLIVVGGALGGTILSNPWKRVLSLGQILKKAFFSESPELVSIVQTLVSFAEKARGRAFIFRRRCGETRRSLYEEVNSTRR